ncbi:hypothetical protein [Streptomyces sp. NPDC058092]|uniref:hypothetical protein n=1 Tax=Streptomyces sp. NPDC058092 TaxID=3346336 RepID=UPI0036E31BCD
MTTIEQLTSQLCDAELDVPISGPRWRQGPFHRALVRLPVRFTPVGMTAETDRREAAGSASDGPSAVSISP